MKIKAVVHEAEEGGYWAEVPAIPGCATQGETMDELFENLREASEGALAVDEPKPGGHERIVENCGMGSVSWRSLLICPAMTCDRS
ncbi:hypothetical protein BH10PSE7_BH10PSE7_37960 [soil metagenome]